MLLNAANMDLPTDEGDHNELDKALNGLKQLKFIKEFWYSKQIDTTENLNKKTQILLLKIIIKEVVSI
jgi:hypothetical protein